VLLREPCLLAPPPAWLKLPSHHGNSGSSFRFDRDWHWTRRGLGDIWLVPRICRLWAAVPLTLAHVTSGCCKERHQRGTCYLFKVSLQDQTPECLKRGVIKRGMPCHLLSRKGFGWASPCRNTATSPAQQHSSTLCVTQPHSAPKPGTPRRGADLWLRCLQRK